MAVDRTYRSQDFIAQYLDTDGDDTGTKNAIGDYSSTADIFYFEPTRRAEIARMVIHIRDDGSWRHERYGGISGGLTNGVRIRVSDDDGVVINLDGGVAIKTNASWGRVCYDVRIDTVGAGQTMLSSRWTFMKSGIPIALDPDRGEKLEVVLNDDLSALEEHYFMVQGRYA